MTKRTSKRKALSERVTQPIVQVLAKTPLTPNTLTWLGFLITVGAAVMVITGHLFAAGFVVLFAGFFDMLDGALARTTNRVTRFGEVLDSTLDRLSEAILLLSLLCIFIRGQQFTESMLVGFALIGSMMVSYLRAKIEILGIECKVGLFTRPERVIILALGLLLSRYDYAMIIALAIITFFSFLTVGQRLIFAWRNTRV
ncbi:CDP-alcohol phosphatidyltransferase family protein [Chloroflexota bacterium]